MFYKKPRFWLLQGLVVVLVGAAILLAAWFNLWEQHDIRYRADRTWEMPQNRNPAVANFPNYGVGVSKQGQPFRVIGSQLHVRAAGDDSRETVLRLPEGLLNPPGMVQTLQASADGERLNFVDDLGMAVWRASPPHERLHHWIANEEPLAGPKVGNYSVGGARLYDNHKLALGYCVSPNGRLACVHPVLQHLRDDQDSKDGVIVIRDLKTGQDIARLVHKDLGLVVDRVAWSGDSKRLATGNSLPNSPGPNFYVTVWDVESETAVARWPEYVDWNGAGRATSQDFGCLALSHDGATVFVVGNAVDKGSPSTPRGGLRLRRVSDGSLVATRACPFRSRVLLSPNDEHVGLVAAGSIWLLEAETLREIWKSSCPGVVRNRAFSTNGRAFAASWFIPNEMFGSSSGVKAWDTATGVVVLKAKGIGYPPTVGFASDGSIVTERQIFSPIVNANARAGR